MTRAQATILWIYAGIITIWPIRYAVLRYIFGRVRFLTPGSPALDPAE